MNKKEFITAVAGYVDKYAPAYGILVHSSVIAQAILESGWGESNPENLQEDAVFIRLFAYRVAWRVASFP